jgi:hypothetical protein
MKKLYVFFGILLILFSGCAAHNWSDSVITNNSTFPVTFKFNNTDVKSLAIGESAVFETEAYQHIESYAPDKRVYFTYEATDAGYTGQFNTRPSWLVKVTNTIGEKATLSADGWMEEMVDIIHGDYVDNENHNGKIYTSNPNFSVSTESGFPAVVTYTYNETDATFFVVIQRSP